MQGRDTELGDLADRWAQAGRVVAVSSSWPASRASASPDHSGRCSSHGPVAGCVPDPSGLFALLCEHSLLPDHPALGRVLEFGPDDTVEQRLDKIDGLLAQYGFDLPSVVLTWPSCWRCPSRIATRRSTMPAERQRQLTIDALVKIALIRATHQPVLFVVEDRIGQGLVARCADATDRTCHRPGNCWSSASAGFAPPWSDGGRLERLDLNRLDRGASVRIVTEIAGMPVPAELLRQLVEKADGVPLYLEELTKLVVEQGLIPLATGGSIRPPAAGAGDPGNARGLADGTARPAGRCQECRAAWGGHRPAILFELLAAVAKTTASVDFRAESQPSRAGRRRTAVRRRGSGWQELHL